MILSITRLRLSRWSYFFPFIVSSQSCIDQALRDPTCIGGATYFGPGLTFWTCTLWKNEAAMKAFLTSGAHLKVMPQLAVWCSEACVIHRETSDLALPKRAELPSLLARKPKFTSVDEPSLLHQSKIISPRSPWLAQAFKK